MPRIKLDVKCRKLWLFVVFLAALPPILLTLILNAHARAANAAAQTPAVPSPLGDRSAYITYKPSGSVLHLVVTGSMPLETSIALQHRFGENCRPTGLDWLDAGAIAIHCEYDPHLYDYLIVNSQTGALIHEYAGVWFMWSPDRQTLAHYGVLQRYTAPDGDNCCLMFNAASVYPPGCHFDGERRSSPHHSHTRPLASIHTFATPLVWSPNSRRLAFFEKIYNWHYGDPYNRDFFGRASEVRYYLAIAGAGEPAVGYAIPDIPATTEVKWINDSEIEAGGRQYDLSLHPPAAIP